VRSAELDDMTADRVIALPERGHSAGKAPAQPWMATGRVDLTGAARHSPRTTAFAYSPDLPTQQRWRISVEGPAAVGAGLERRGDRVRTVTATDR
jgi:hypothetical protein